MSSIVVDSSQLLLYWNAIIRECHFCASWTTFTFLALFKYNFLVLNMEEVFIGLSIGKKIYVETGEELVWMWAIGVGYYVYATTVRHRYCSAPWVDYSGLGQVNFNQSEFRIFGKFRWFRESRFQDSRHWHLGKTISATQFLLRRATRLLL